MPLGLFSVGVVMVRLFAASIEPALVKLEALTALTLASLSAQIAPPDRFCAGPAPVTVRLRLPGVTMVWLGAVPARMLKPAIMPPLIKLLAVTLMLPCPATMPVVLSRVPSTVTFAPPAP